MYWFPNCRALERTAYSREEYSRQTYDEFRNYTSKLGPRID